MKFKTLGLMLLVLVCASCTGGSGGGGNNSGVGDAVAMSTSPFDPTKASGTGCDNELQQLAATQFRYPVNVDTLGGAWGGQWELVCGLVDDNQCPPPNSLICDFGDIQLSKIEDSKMRFLGIGRVQNVGNLDPWYLVLNSGSDSDLTRNVALEPYGSEPVNLEISLFFDGQYGYMLMTRGDYNRRTIYRSKTTGAPSY